jgi:Ulp1 family protease
MKDQLLVISCLTYHVWTIGAHGEPAGWANSNRRFVAFVGIENEHFTLSILSNQLWVQPDSHPPKKQRKAPHWTLLHFDSSRDTEAKETFAMEQAQKFACWVLGIKERKLKHLQVPVPQQDEDSNDCGVYATHFLREFMDDPDAALSFCEKVRAPNTAALFLNP